MTDISTLQNNGKAYSRLHPSARDILKKADGERDYRSISKELGIDKTKVNNLLSKAVAFNLAKKIKPGIYKKEGGVLGYIPKNNSLKKSRRTVKDIVRKFSKKRKKRIDLNITNFRTSFEGKVEKMSEAYRWLFITENVLRELIREVFKLDNNWWSKRVPLDVKKEVQKQMDKYPYDGAKRKDELEYTHLGQLKDIILLKGNWDKFLPYLKKRDKDTFKVFVERSIPPRNSIGHCIGLVGDDYKRADMRFKDILSLLK